VIRLLLVEDNNADARLVQLSLAEVAAGQYDTIHTAYLSEALQLLEQSEFDAVLLDLHLPDSYGLDTVRQIAHAHGQVPIVVLSGMHDTELALQAVQGGAQDYLVKGVYNGELIARAVRYAIERKQIEVSLRSARAKLERRVAERTAELKTANEHLQREIAERRHAQAVLRKEHEFTVTVLDTIDAMVMILDRNGCIVNQNRASEETLGYPTAEIKGMPFWDICVLPEEADEAKAVFSALRQEHAPKRYENDLLTRSGQQRLISWSSSTLLDEHGAIEHVIATGIDITERRRAEDLERQRMLEMAHILRLHTIDQMTTEIAHELNQPLTAIVSYSDAVHSLLQSGKFQTGDMVRAVQTITAQAHRAAEIIRRLRDFVRKDEMARSTQAIDALIREVIHLAEPEIRRHGVQTQLRMSDALPPVWADDVLIQQVVLNLIHNAIEAMDGLETGRRVLTIEASLVTDDTIEVAVDDTGPGLPEEIVGRVFEPFFTTKPAGMGMGLSISQSIVEAHGGRLWVTSNPHNGATFRFTLLIHCDTESAETFPPERRYG